MVPAARAGARDPRPARRGRRSQLRSGCSRLTNAACSPGTPRGNPCCGGRPIRAWCCFPRSSSAPGASAKRSVTAGSPAASTRTSRPSSRACAAPGARARKPGSTTRCSTPTVNYTAGIRPLRGGLRRRGLVGGLYGMRLAGVFFGESMFSRERDASKAALARLVAGVQRPLDPAHRLPGRELASIEPGRPRACAQRLRLVARASRAARSERPLGARAWLKLHYQGALCTMRPASYTP